MGSLKPKIQTEVAEPAVAEKRLPLGERPLIMGVLNVTPDSFSDGGQHLDPDRATDRAIKMAEEGADIIDIGGESTRPGALDLPTAEEIKRVMPVLERLHGKLAIPLSIDTKKSAVAREACQAGASIINDISALSNDDKIADVAKEYKTYLILMHMRGTPATMQQNIHYDDLIGEISDFLRRAAAKALAHGIAKNNIIIDPGIGFGKTVEHNFSLLKHIPAFARLGYPVLIGASRKSFIGKTLDLPVEERLTGSLAAAIYGVLNGVSIVRVHDVVQTVRALKIIEGIAKAD